MRYIFIFFFQECNFLLLAGFRTDAADISLLLERSKVMDGLYTQSTTDLKKKKKDGLV